MKILHTADWHLNDRLGRIDRTDDLRAAVERVAVQCRETKADVLLVAGDLFSEQARPDALRETIAHWNDAFAGFLSGGGTIVAITGNHDNETFCQTLCSAMALASPAVGKPGDLVPAGRLYLAADPTWLRLRDPRDGFDVPFVLMPFPTPAHYLRGDVAPKYTDPDEKGKAMSLAFDERLRELVASPDFDPTAPAVLAAHVHLWGAKVGPSLFRITEQQDVVVDGGAMADRFAYVALGHIHKPQYLMDRKHVRYSGSIERLDLGERDDAKGTVLFELGPKGVVGEIVTLPVPSTAVYEVTVVDPSVDLPRLKAESPNAERDLVNLHVRYTAGRDNLEAVLRELDKIFPRWYARDWEETGRLIDGTLAEPEADRTKGFAETVREYLGQELIQYPDADRDAILALAEDLLGDSPE